MTLGRLLALAALVLALAAACGGSDEPAASPPAPPAEAPAEPPAEPPAETGAAPPAETGSEPPAEAPAEPPAEPPADIPPAPTPAEGAAPWPVPDNPAELAEAAGLEFQRREFLIFHVHAHLDVYVNGEFMPVPAAIGIDINDPGVKSGTINGAPAYGGIEMCEQPCISPVHTHDNSGIIHTESTQRVLNTLGEFFIEWDVQLDENCVGGYCRPDANIAVYVDGEPYEGDPAEIELRDLREIAIVIGTPPAEVPSGYDWGSATA